MKSDREHAAFIERLRKYVQVHGPFAPNSSGSPYLKIAMTSGHTFDLYDPKVRVMDAAAFVDCPTVRLEEVRVHGVPCQSIAYGDILLAVIPK